MRALMSCLLLLLAAALVRAVQPVGPADAGAPAPVRSAITPLYLEHAAGPHTLTPEDGWQVGGVNTHVAVGGALSLSGGYYYSRALAARQLLDPREPAASAFDPRARAGEVPLLRLFDAGPSHGDATADQLTFQRLNYTKGGLKFSGSYLDVGTEFKGLDPLKQQLAGSDPAAAKALAPGMSQRDYTMSYTGAHGMRFSSTYARVAHTEIGHPADGLIRTTATHGIGLALGQRHKLDYTVSSLTEAWDPEKQSADRVDRDVDTQALRLSGGLGRKSEFAIGQMLTSTTAGGARTDVTQRDVAMKWNEWKSLAFSAGYTTQETEQAHERADTLALDFAAPLSAACKLTGKLARTEVEQQGAGQTQEQNLLDLRLTSRLTPRLQLTSHYKDTEALDASTEKLRDYQLAYALTERWKATCRLSTLDRSTTGESAMVEYGVIGQVGAKARPRQLTLHHRDERLPGDATQGRTVLAYAQPLGKAKSPIVLQVKAGDYAYTTQGDRKEKVLLSAQILAAKPTPRSTFAIGYYDGPVVGADAISYRAWGRKLPAKQDAAWQTADMADYDELGGELTHALTDHTKVMARRYAGNIAGVGDQETTEYGAEQRFGALTLTGGQRETELPDQAETQEESWWRAALPLAQQLPDWATGSLRVTLFSDGASWGGNAAPAWAAKPTPGLEVGRRNVLIGDQRVDGEDARYATMLGRRFFLHGSYERNPNKPNTAAEVEAVRRGLCHLAVAASPTMTLFARYLDEGTLDGATATRTRSLGVIGAFSAQERLQLQMDLVRQTAEASPRTGVAYTLEYARAMDADNSLSLKARLTAKAFCQPDDGLRLECSYRKAF